MYLFRWLLPSIFLILFATTAGANDEQSSRKLAALLRAAREVVTRNPQMIDDPVFAEFSVAEGMKETYRNYRRTIGIAPDESDPVKSLLLSIEDIFKKAVGGKYKEKWLVGPYAKKFLPARFAREVAISLVEKSGGKYVLHLTAPNELLVNKDNAPDAWERNVIETKFQTVGWGKDRTFSETAPINGKPAFRFILPEYYSEGCMGCHGENGKDIHHGKVVGKLGQLAGAISVAILNQ